MRFPPRDRAKRLLLKQESQLRTKRVPILWVVAVHFCLLAAQGFSAEISDAVTIGGKRFFTDGPVRYPRRNGKAKRTSGPTMAISTVLTSAARFTDRIGFLIITRTISFCPAAILAEAPITTVVQTIKAPEAYQGVAVDEDYVYAIDTKAIAKYDKKTGKRIARWKASKKDKIIHLDSGVIVDGKLYAGHSNFPGIPMESSIEIWDAKTLKYIESIPLGAAYGSCTWIDRYAGAWWVCYAHYEGKGGYDGIGPERTTLVKYDDKFNELGRWTFPKEVVGRFSPHSCSGGSWGPDGLLYCSGHDRPELYALQIPQTGNVLELIRTIKIESRGQGIAWDRTEENAICTIKRKERVVVISRVGQLVEFCEIQ